MSSTRPYAPPKKIGGAFRFIVVVLLPLLHLLAKRDWRGGENIPSEGGCVIAANHISHVDAVMFGHFVYGNGRLPRFLAKSGVFKNKALGAIFRSAGQIPVYRDSADAANAFRDAVKAVNEGEAVAVYPEGTITRDPAVWPMTAKSGAARIALATGCPVIPVAQWGAQEILAYGEKRPHFFPRKTMRMLAGPPVELGDLRELPLTAETMRVATDRIMDAITVLLGEIRGEAAPEERFAAGREAEDGRGAVGGVAAGVAAAAGAPATATAPATAPATATAPAAATAGAAAAAMRVGVGSVADTGSAVDGVATENHVPAESAPLGAAQSEENKA